mmetsp:Transcript_21039/g.24030  ORF Transcript_21039/g.24030 Transcript_21039/m.24030 type:complete len:518 (+) Transcript_21039:168-1721(+)
MTLNALFRKAVQLSVLRFPTVFSFSFFNSLDPESYYQVLSRPSTKLFSSFPDFEMENNSKYTQYEQWVRRLYQTNMFHPVKLGLKNIENLHEALGAPTDQVPVVHIAGTNGKGSVALKIATTLQKLNPSLCVALFCSPHISSFRERMQINGELISEEDVVKYLPEIYAICKKNDIPATFFEITTALAFIFFRKADIIVLETGLGGRLDATNVVKSPSLSVITSIGLEHTRILGNTVEEIAMEKGGIIKKSRPVLVGPNVPHDVLQKCAEQKGASEYLTCDDVLGKSNSSITDYDEENTRTAKAALVILQKEIPDLIEILTPDIVAEGTSVRPSCRFEIVEMDDDLTVVLDVAHNPQALKNLFQKVKNEFPDRNFRIVVGISADKDIGLMGEMLLEVVNSNAIHLVEALHPRAAKVEAIVEACPQLKNTRWSLEDCTITSQIQSALLLARSNNEIVVVCGSVFLMAEAREALGFDEPQDSIYIAEVAGAHLKHGQEVFANSELPNILSKAEVMSKESN